MVEMLQIHFWSFFRGESRHPSKSDHLDFVMIVGLVNAQALTFAPSSGFQWWLNPQRLLP